MEEEPIKRELAVPFRETRASDRVRDGGQAEPGSGPSMTGRRRRTRRETVVREEILEEEWCCDVRSSVR